MSEPLSDAELDRIEEVAKARIGSRTWLEVTVVVLVAEVRRLRERNAAYEAQETPLAWTPTPPAEPGWYWHRTGPDAIDLPTVLEVATYGGELVIWIMGEPDTLTDWSGEWAGPISPPI